MKPVIVLPPGVMSKRDMKRLNDNDFCVVECKEPERVRFCEPPPLGYSVQEKAAIQLSRRLLAAKNSWNINRKDLCEILADCLMEGWPLTGSPLAPVQPVKK